ncbi:MAG: HAMP domain-containing sensor histidine kinase, partial [Pontixanthobacter sp.]
SVNTPLDYAPRKLIQMIKMSQLQGMALIVAVTTFGLVHYLLIDQVPHPYWGASAIAAAALILWWAGSIAWLRWRRSISGNDPDDWYFHTVQVFWFGSLTSIWCFWMLMPFASEPIIMLAVFFCMGPIAIEVIGTVRSPDRGERGWWGQWAQLVIPIGLIAYFLIRPSLIHLAIASYLAIFSALMWLLRAFIQESVDRAHLALRTVERMSHERDRFLASASHDFGQPLQAARLFVDQALQQPDPVKRGFAIRNADWAFDSMARMIAKLSHDLRLQGGTILPELRRVNLLSLLQQAIDQASPIAERHGAKLRLVPSTAIVCADPDLIERGLSNLVNNALIHAKPDRILIGCQQRGKMLRIWCIDNGRGVAAADHDRLFTDYVQGTDHGDEVRGGFGLGLSGTRAMARLMGGDAGLDSRWTGGSAFWLEIPVETTVGI